MSCAELTLPPHSSLSAGYGPASGDALSQLLMATPSAPSPTAVVVSAEQIRGLDLAALTSLAALPPAELLSLAGSLELQLQWLRADEDPRELSEVPELRLWSLRADALCPWLPLLLHRSSGQLTRHVAMLLPHGFQPQEGIRFAPESLELWIIGRLFLLDAWALASGLNCRQGLAQMAAVLGFELDPGFWDPLPLP